MLEPEVVWAAQHLESWYRGYDHLAGSIRFVDVNDCGCLGPDLWWSVEMIRFAVVETGCETVSGIMWPGWFLVNASGLTSPWQMAPRCSLARFCYLFGLSMSVIQSWRSWRSVTAEHPVRVVGEVDADRGDVRILALGSWCSYFSLSMIFPWVNFWDFWPWHCGIEGIRHTSRLKTEVGKFEMIQTYTKCRSRQILISLISVECPSHQTGSSWLLPGTWAKFLQELLALAVAKWYMLVSWGGHGIFSGWFKTVITSFFLADMNAFYFLDFA